MKRIVLHSPSEAALLLDIPSNTMLYFRKKGWIFAPRKSSPNGQINFYTAEDLIKLRKLIKKLKEQPRNKRKRKFGSKENNSYYH